MFRELGVGWGLAELEQHYSPDWYAVYRAANIPETRWDEANRVWRAHYAKHPSKLIRPARRVLAQLSKRHRLGLVSSGDRDRVSRQLREFGLTRVFRSRVLGGDTPGEKATSGAVAEGAAGDEGGGAALRLRGRYAGGRGDGEGCGSASDCGAGPVSDGEAIAGGAAGNFVGRIGGVTGGFAGDLSGREAVRRQVRMGANGDIVCPRSISHLRRFGLLCVSPGLRAGLNCGAPLALGLLGGSLGDAAG